MHLLIISTSLRAAEPRRSTTAPTASSPVAPPRSANAVEAPPGPTSTGNELRTATTLRAKKSARGTASAATQNRYDYVLIPGITLHKVCGSCMTCMIRCAAAAVDRLSGVIQKSATAAA